MKSHSHIGFWIVTFLVSILVSPAFVTPEKIYDRLASEVVSVRSVFGEAVGDTVVTVTNRVHGMFVTTGADAAVRQGIHTEDERRQAEKYFSVIGKVTVNSMNSYFEGLSMQFYGVLLRAAIVVIWSLLLAPFMLATIVDAISARQVKLAELGYQNPTAFSLASHALIALCALPLLYIAVPMALPATFMFWWALIAALPMGFALSHMQPVLTR